MYALSSAKEGAGAGNQTNLCPSAQQPKHGCCSFSGGMSPCLGAAGLPGGGVWGTPHVLLASGYGLQVVQVSSHQEEREAQPIILQGLAMDVPCLTVRAGL